MTISLAGTAALLALAGIGYLTLLGAAGAAWLLPRSWRALAPCVVPHLGWALLVALGYPLNAALPFHVVLWLLGGVAGAALLARYGRQALRDRPRLGAADARGAPSLTLSGPWLAAGAKHPEGRCRWFVQVQTLTTGSAPDQEGALASFARQLARGL